MGTVLSWFFFHGEREGYRQQNDNLQDRTKVLGRSGPHTGRLISTIEHVNLSVCKVERHCGALLDSWKALKMKAVTRTHAPNPDDLDLADEIRAVPVRADICDTEAVVTVGQTKRSLHLQMTCDLTGKLKVSEGAMEWLYMNHSLLPDAEGSEGESKIKFLLLRSEFSIQF